MIGAWYVGTEMEYIGRFYALREAIYAVKGTIMHVPLDARPAKLVRGVYRLDNIRAEGGMVSIYFVSEDYAIGRGISAIARVWTRCTESISLCRTPAGGYTLRCVTGNPYYDNRIYPRRATLTYPETHAERTRMRDRLVSEVMSHRWRSCMVSLQASLRG